MQLTAHHYHYRGAAVVSFEGEIDLAVRDDFQQELTAGLDEASELPGRLLIVDLQSVSFFTSSGIGKVLRCRADADNNGIAVGVVTANPHVTRIIVLSRLDELVTVCPTIDAAIQSLVRASLPSGIGEPNTVWHSGQECS